jgi:hypothetical protein
MVLDARALSALPMRVCGHRSRNAASSNCPPKKKNPSGGCWGSVVRHIPEGFVPSQERLHIDPGLPATVPRNTIPYPAPTGRAVSRSRYSDPPMTLANMRENGVRSLSGTWELCHREARTDPAVETDSCLTI